MNRTNEGAAQLNQDAIGIRRDMSVFLDHAIARLGKYSDGWMTCDDGDRDAVYTIQHAKWSLEAMNAPCSNRFWDEQRREYREMLNSLSQ